MSATLESRTALWLLGLFSIGVYIFQFAPIVVVMLLSFNASRSGAFPMEGVSLQWYGKLFANDAPLTSATERQCRSSPGSDPHDAKVYPQCQRQRPYGRCRS